jgi:hypothetical protein
VGREIEAPGPLRQERREDQQRVDLARTRRELELAETLDQELTRRCERIVVVQSVPVVRRSDSLS